MREMLERVQFSPTFSDHVGVEKARQLPRHEKTASQQIRACITASVLENTRVFRRSELTQHLARNRPHRLTQSCDWTQPVHYMDESRNVVKTRITAEHFVA